MTEPNMLGDKPVSGDTETREAIELLVTGTFSPLPPAFTAQQMNAILRAGGEDPIDVTVSVLKIAPGDIIVIRAPGPIRTEHAERLRTEFERQFPEQRALVLSDGISVDGVLRPVAKAEGRQ